ncbi:MAG: SDR family NAD(P)-dependent oxidoreductase [Candidatus Entotheonellia bacterium]
MGFPGKVAMVTGAGSGIGFATARALAQAGVRVALCDVNREALDKAASEVARIGITPLTYELDVADRARVDAVVGDIARACGKLDILFNAAGILQQPINLLEMSEALWDQHWDVNLMGTIFCAQAAAHEMIRRQYGRIINVASIAGDLPRLKMGHYCVTKAGVKMLTKCLALELASRGVTVNAIAPGPTDTPMIRGISAADASLEAAHRVAVQGAPEAFRLGIPTGRLSTPEDQAAAVLFLASEAAAQITGHILYVDGMAKLV